MFLNDDKLLIPKNQPHWSIANMIQGLYVNKQAAEILCTNYGTEYVLFGLGCKSCVNNIGKK